ncbi:MAG: serine hydrolase domain-containing protein [Terrimicrobiaceae bacterium]
MKPLIDSQSLATVLEPFVSAGSLAGAVLMVCSKDGILAHETVGFADIAAGIPMSPDTFFWIASMTKPFTSTALMMLVEEGGVRLDDPVERYLPEFKGQMMIAEQDAEHVLLRPPAHPITVREVLAHTSGLPFQSPLESPTLDRLSLKVAVGSYAMENLRFEPGSKYEYSNEGTNTAGRIIEVVANVPYDKFLNDRLLGPLGMDETVFVPRRDQLQRLAKSYKPDAANTGLEETPIKFLSYPLTDPGRQPIPGGGLFSTATDLVQFCRMILSGGELDGRHYVSTASIHEMTTKQTGPQIEKAYGLGWGIEGTAFGHGGAHGTQMFIDPESGLATIYLVQHDGFPGDGASSYERFVQTAKAHYTCRALPGRPNTLTR